MLTMAAGTEEKLFPLRNRKEINGGNDPIAESESLLLAKLTKVSFSNVPLTQSKASTGTSSKEFMSKYSVVSDVKNDSHLGHVDKPTFFNSSVQTEVPSCSIVELSQSVSGVSTTCSSINFPSFVNALGSFLNLAPVIESLIKVVAELSKASSDTSLRGKFVRVISFRDAGRLSLVIVVMVPF